MRYMHGRGQALGLLSALVAIVALVISGCGGGGGGTTAAVPISTPTATPQPSSNLNGVLQGSYGIVLGATLGGNALETEVGTLTFDGQGNITGGTLHRNDGVDATITGGTYSVSANATYAGNVTAGGVTTTFYGFICADGTISFSIEDPLRLGVGIGTRGPSTTSSNADLSGTYGFGDLLISAANVPNFVYGNAVANGNGTITGGGVQYANGTTTAITGGAYAIAADGTFTSGNVTQADGATITVTSGTLHADKTIMSGTVRTGGGNSGLLLLIR